VVAPATTRCRDRVVCHVSLCQDYSYFLCEDYMLMCEDYESSLSYVLFYDCCILFLLYALFWRLPIRGGSKNRDYIKNQYISRLTKKHMDTWSRHGGGGPSIFLGYM
jgi:hypothetical protein